MTAEFVLRFDLSDGGLSKPEYLSDGSAIFTGRVARTGDHSYPWGIERRDAIELQNIVRQLNDVPVTAFHPAILISQGGVARIVGKVLSGSSRVDGIFAEAKLHLNPEGVALVKAGIRELSLGYSVKAINGNHTNTRVDHVALVPAARCGEACAVRTDQAVRLDCEGCNICNCSTKNRSLAVQTINQLTVMRGK